MRDDQRIESKVIRVEESVETIKDLLKSVKEDNDDLYKEVAELKTVVALLRQSLDVLNANNDSKRGFFEKILMLGVGGFVASAVSWIIRGGLSQ